MPNTKAGKTLPASKIPVKEKFKIIYRFASTPKHHLKVTEMCEILEVSKSGYYGFVSKMNNPSQKDIQDIKDFELIKKAYDFRNRKKGARQIKMTLQSHFFVNMNLKKIRRLMKKFNLVCPIRKSNPARAMARKLTTSHVAPNKLNRVFKTNVPGRILLTDITYIFYGPNKNLCYLSTIKDCASNEILSYKLSKTLDMPFVLETVKGLKKHRFVDFENCILHSDQGCHYTSILYQDLLKKLEISQSMSRRGNCWDNAPMESFFGHMKDELHLKDCNTYEDVFDEIFDYMYYYNFERCQWNLNKTTPIKYRNYLLSQNYNIVPIANIKKEPQLNCSSNSFF